MKAHILLGIVAFIALVSRGAAAQQREVTLVRTGCYGTCPYYQVTLRADGSVIYDGRAHVRKTGIKKKKIDPASFELVWAKVEGIHFWDLEDRYDHVVTIMPDGKEITTIVSDLPEERITVLDEHRSKKVIDYFGAPKSLKELEDLIDRVADISTWVRGKPKEPNHTTEPLSPSRGGSS